MSHRIERIGDCELHLADCAGVLARMSSDCAIVSDPPYGMAWNTDTRRFTSSGHILSHGKRRSGRNDSKKIANDDKPFDPSHLLRFSEVILWGANHFGRVLPRGSTLVWIKQADHAFGTFLSDAEVAWQNTGMGVYCHKDFTMKGEVNHRVHPSQKPVGLMVWCVARTKSGTIIDPYMGSGTTGIAAIKLGRKFVGMELDEAHFETACRRIEEAYKQPDMFVSASSPKAEQLDLLGAAE